MHEQNDKLKDLRFIKLPSSMEERFNDFSVDSSIELPVQLPDGKSDIDTTSEIGFEMIIAGMLKIIAFSPDHPHFDYYRRFVLAAQPNAVEELNLAAIAKEKNHDMDFAEELFLTVNHLLPQSATFINLATLYSSRAAQDEKKGTEYDFYQQKALSTLKEGVDKFPEDADLLNEIGFFHIYQGNIEVAGEYLDRYLKVAPEGEKKEHAKRIRQDIGKKLQNDSTLMQAYDEIQMSNEEKALSLLDPYLKQNGKIWNGWFLAGWAHRRLGHFTLAEEAFMKCLSLGERSSDIYNELSLCALESGRTELAKNYLNTAVDLDENNLTLVSNLAYLHLRDREWDEAREYLELARNIDEKDPVIRKLMNDYREATGDDLTEKPIVQEYVDTSRLKEQEAERHKKEKPFHVQGKEDTDDIHAEYEPHDHDTDKEA